MRLPPDGSFPLLQDVSLRSCHITPKHSQLEINEVTSGVYKYPHAQFIRLTDELSRLSILETSRAKLYDLPVPRRRGRDKRQSAGGILSATP